MLTVIGFMGEKPALNKQPSSSYFPSIQYYVSRLLSSPHHSPSLPFIICNPGYIFLFFTAGPLTLISAVEIRQRRRIISPEYYDSAEFGLTTHRGSGHIRGHVATTHSDRAAPRGFLVLSAGHNLFRCAPLSRKRRECDIWFVFVARPPKTTTESKLV